MYPKCAAWRVFTIWTHLCHRPQEQGAAVASTPQAFLGHLLFTVCYGEPLSWLSRRDYFCWFCAFCKQDQIICSPAYLASLAQRCVFQDSFMFLCAIECCLFLLLCNIAVCDYSLFISILWLGFVYVLALCLLIVLLRTFWFIFWWTYVHSSVRSLPRSGTVSHSGYNMFSVSQYGWGFVTEWLRWVLLVFTVNCCFECTFLFIQMVLCYI